MNEFNPGPYLVKIQKQKYKIAIIPILVVMISFFLNYNYQYQFVKYLSLAGLFGYILVILCYKVNKAVPPNCDVSHILSPVSGRIESIEKKSIVISKSIIDPIDIRCPTSYNNLEIEWQNRKPRLFTENCRLAGKLIGMISGRAKCIIRIPDDYNIQIIIGEKIKAGETILAKLSEN